MTDIKGGLPQRFLNSGARGHRFESCRAYHSPHLESITYGLSLVCRAGCDLLLLPHFPASFDKELTSNPRGGVEGHASRSSNGQDTAIGRGYPCRYRDYGSTPYRGGGRSGHLTQPVSNPAREISFAGGGVEYITTQQRDGMERSRESREGRDSRRVLGGTILRPGKPCSGENPARQHQYPTKRDTKGRACPAGQRGVLPAARASVPSRVGAGARGATPLPSQQTVAVPGPAPDGEPGISSANR